MRRSGYYQNSTNELGSGLRSRSGRSRLWTGRGGFGAGAAGRSEAGKTFRGIAGKTAYSLTCILAALVLVGSGFSYFAVRDVSSIGASHAIVSGPSIGAQNILLMGLESRTDWNGNILPNNILDKLHAGSRQAVLNGTGGNATNTLILIHIFTGGKRAVGFSIPRDDWVNFAGTAGPQQQGKIDQAYGVSMFYQQAQLRQQQPNLSQNQLAFAGNEAGRKAAVATVEQLTGEHVDHFAEVNLDGFYELARVFDGVNVCLNHAVSDFNSGANFRAGHQHLNPAQSLAFVRQRDGLTNGDLDRTHRQQAFIDSMLLQLRTEGLFSDLSKVAALLAVAKRYVITDSGWNLLDFAEEAQGLTGANLVFHTLPIEGYSKIGAQDVNLVNPAYIKAIVDAAFSSPASPAHRHHRVKRGATRTAPTVPMTARVTVLNGAHMNGMATRVSDALHRAGYKVATPGNTSSQATTTVLYGTGASAEAGKIATIFGAPATASASVTAGHIELLIGADTTTVPVISGAAGTPTSTPAATAAPTTAIPTTGPQGGAVGAQTGIPCVN